MRISASISTSCPGASTASSPRSTGCRSATSTRAIRATELAGFYRASDIALITPLRDGMNLVAKEYVAAQDPEDPGVLILSRFAGAALQLKDALLVNPYSKDEISDAIRQGARHAARANGSGAGAR